MLENYVNDFTYLHVTVLSARIYSAPCFLFMISIIVMPKNYKTRFNNKNWQIMLNHEVAILGNFSAKPFNKFLMIH